MSDPIRTPPGLAYILADESRERLATQLADAPVGTTFDLVGKALISGEMVSVSGRTDIEITAFSVHITPRGEDS